VLPLMNLNAKDENLDYFSIGVTQEIIDELAKVSSFAVTAFTTSFQYMFQKKSSLEIANELDVNYLISGTSRVFGDSVKLSIELFNPHTNERIWNGSFNELMEKAPSIQLSIARQVIKSLNIKLTAEEDGSLDRINTTSGEAFDLFLKAKGALASLTQEGFAECTRLLDKAIELDPNYAQAYTLLAWNSLLTGAPWFGGTRSASEIVSIAAPLIEKSISLNPESSDNYLVRANMNLFLKGLLHEAEKDVEYALELNSWPRIPTNYCICTVVSTYVSLHKLEKAKDLAVLARTIDPWNVFIYWDEGNIHMIQGEFKKAQALYEESLNVLDVPLFQFFVGLSYYHDNQFNEALEFFEKASAAIGFHMSYAYLSNTHFKLGNIQKSEQYRQELERRMASGNLNVYLALAQVAAAQSNIDETLTWLEKAQENSSATFAYMANVDPIFLPLVDEPRFIEIRRKMQYFE
jgi:adenylate cyclase